MLEDGGGGLLLLVGWVAVLAEDALDHDPNLRADSFAFRPINRHAVADGLDQLPDNV